MHSDSSVSPSPIRQTYTGRFAPSPTGPLHLGSLFTALASYLDARANQGKWLLRIDDLDTPRNRPGAAADILRCLEAFGLHWDDAVYYQSRHLPDYKGYLEDLADRKLIYRCQCSRKRLADFSRANEAAQTPSVYPGTCRDRSVSADAPSALRVKAQSVEIACNDLLQGGGIGHIASEHGDFILKRRDGIVAYQFAVVIDDHLQNISHIVRGRDLLAETPKQIFLQQLLGFNTPFYAHVPVIVDRDGYKLSKQTLADAVDPASASRNLFRILVMLKQNPPIELEQAPVHDLLNWAISNWRLSAMANVPVLQVND